MSEETASVPAVPLKVLGLIPARGGSKGVPRKNVRPLAGRPLIHYACDCARDSTWINRAIVSTDCPEIAAAAEAAGVDVPFRRPAQLADDGSTTLSVIEHALHWLREQEQYVPDLIVLLQPTAPLRTAQHVDEAILRLRESAADSIVSVCRVPEHFNAHWQFAITDAGMAIATGEAMTELIPRRQSLPPCYVRNGAIYAFYRRALQQHGTIYGASCLPYEMPVELSVNIDSLDDWREAERQMRTVGGRNWNEVA